MSDLIGFIMVFSLVVSVVAVVSLAGLGSLESARDAEQSNNAERAMEVLADNMADIHDRGAPSRATEISLQDASIRLGQETQVVVQDKQNGTDDPSFLTRNVFHVRPIVYDDGDTQLVYVMGALFRDQPDGGAIIQSWSPVLDEERTMIPVVQTASATGGSQSVQSSTVLVRALATNQTAPVTDTESGATYNETWINVSSQRRDLWDRMLSESPDLSCSTNGPWVNCSLGPDPEQLYVSKTRIAVEITQ